MIDNPITDSASDRKKHRQGSTDDHACREDPMCQLQVLDGEKPSIGSLTHLQSTSPWIYVPPCSGGLSTLPAPGIVTLRARKGMVLMIGLSS